MFLIYYTYFFKLLLTGIFMFQRIKNLLRPREEKANLEVPREEYYNNRLLLKDARELRPFVDNLSMVMKEHYFLPVSILAVGSSTFPDAYWKVQRDLLNKHPRLNIPYQDIDLLILPEETVSLDKLGKSVSHYLHGAGFEFKSYNCTCFGVRYSCGKNIDEEGKTQEEIFPSVQIICGIHSITTSLPNGTSLDLILGREIKETDFDKNASQKIAEERKNNRPFSLLSSSKDISD